MSEKPNWVQDHIEQYRTDPEAAHLWDASSVGGPKNVPCLLLTTTGRKSGKERPTPLIFGKVSEGYVIVASKGGAPDHPAWYLNLRDNPKVKVQVAADKFEAMAETVGDENYDAWWDQMVEIWPPYTDYKEKTDRKIPLVLLKRV